MSTATLSTASLASSPVLGLPVTHVASSPRAASRVKAIRRRPTREQGRALEIVGHAIEYLVDSRMFVGEHPSSRADHEASRILMEASRSVFSECAEIVPVARRVRRMVAGWIPAGGFGVSRTS